MLFRFRKGFDTNTPACPNRKTASHTTRRLAVEEEYSEGEDSEGETDTGDSHRVGRITTLDRDSSIRRVETVRVTNK